MQYYYARWNLRKIFTDWAVVLFIAIGACYMGSSQAADCGNNTDNGNGNPGCTNNGGNGGSSGNGGNGGNGTGGNASNTNNITSTGGTGIGLGGNSIASAGSTVTTTTSAIALGQGGTAKGGNASANGGDAKSDQKQQQGQDQAQHQNATANSAVHDSGNGGVSNVDVNTSNKAAANTASAVPVTVIQSDSCQVGVAAGGQAVAFGFSFSGTRGDENCERIKLWRELRQAGYTKEALSLLMQDERVAKAFGQKKQANNVYEGKEVASYR